MKTGFGALALRAIGSIPCAALATLLVMPGLTSAYTGKQPWEEYDKVIQARGAVTAHGPEIFGDQVDLYSGALSFSVTDISVPGNSRLPVALTRTMTVSNRRLYPNDGPLADWDLDLPHLSGVYAPTWPSDRCSSTRNPGTAFSGSTAYGVDEYWHGVQAHMPGGGEMLAANQSAPKPSTGGPYPWMTSALTYFSCLPSINNGAGEGFLAITADGTRYWFNHMAQYYEPQLASPITVTPSPYPLTRKRNVLYATRVEDRFGNWVTYSYSNSATATARLNSIQASDGRAISLTYNAQGSVATASNGSQTWTYQYAYPSTGGTLTAVVLPDTSRWSLDLAALSNAEIQFDGDQPRSCEVPAMVLPAGPIVGSVTHPSGAVGEFEVQHRRLGRSNVPMFCANWEYPINNRLNDIAIVPRDMDVLAMERKSVSGPGLVPGTWQYEFMAARTWAPGTGPNCQTEDCLEPVCVSDACAGSSTATITGPNGQWKRYSFGNSYRYNEGKLLKVEQGTGESAILRTETMAYELAQSGQPFATPIGTSLQGRGAGFTSEYLRPQRGKTISQDGATFNSAVNAFDVFARPTSVTRFSSLGHTRAEVTTYHDNLSEWVLGQMASLTIGGVQTSRTDYNANALPYRTYTFGKWQQGLTYHADGALATVSDGNGNVTTLGSWYRGIPRSITYADTTTQSAVVTPLGWITSTTDQNGFATNYSYDALGRLASIVYPTGDTTAWSSTTQVIVPVASVEYGIPAGHWRQTVSTGNARKISYFDAMWRPLLVREYDAANVAGTQRFTRYAYDEEGRVTFASYPSTASSPLTGTWTAYDVLGRTTSISQDSEHGLLMTGIEYLPGFKRRTTNPRGKVTTEAFQAFDVPSYDTPLQIDMAEGTAEQVRTLISRDVFGKPTEVLRGPGG